MAKAQPFPHASPDWNTLFSFAQEQEGLFTTQQAAAAGYSSPLLHKYLASGKVRRVRRGIYRLVHYPPGDHEGLVVYWLWAERAGVFSHLTALALLDLSDVLPAQVHLTLPASWNHRRLRVPAGLMLHYADVPDRDCMRHGPVPVTTPKRTLHDCIESDLAPDLLLQAVRQARRRGLLARTEEADLTAALYGHAPQVS